VGEGEALGNVKRFLFVEEGVRNATVLKGFQASGFPYFDRTVTKMILPVEW
jgi:hypothetical protein